MTSNHEALLRAILGVLARQAFSPDRLGQVVLGKSSGEKQLRAFNMCDGTRTQSEIAKTLNLDSGNFSRTVSRWVDAGVVFRLGEGRESRLLHVYPLSQAATKTKEREK